MMMGIAAYDELGMTELPGAGAAVADRDGYNGGGGGHGDLVDAVIVSDIHLGSENCQAKAIGELLQKMLDGELRARRLIINGDVFDSIDFRRLKKTHWKVLSLLRHLSDKIRRFCLDRQEIMMARREISVAVAGGAGGGAVCAGNRLGAVGEEVAGGAWAPV